MLAGYAEIVRKVASRKRRDTCGRPTRHSKRTAASEGKTVDELLLDGVHPNAKGHALVAKLLLFTMQATGADAPP